MPLRTSGILDSFATMGLVDFVARQFAVELNVYDTSIERFDRIADMAAVVSQKRGGREAMLPTSAER
jgi:acyl carrier protein